MREVSFHSKALNQEFKVGRVIGELHGNEEGPALVFFGGVHGNEPAGVIALKRVFDQLKTLDLPIKGSVYAYAGNMAALEKGARYINQDLNRMWTKERMTHLKNGTLPEDQKDADTLEQMELFQIGEALFKRHKHQIHCIDIHTTSAESIPFVTCNDTLINRYFSEKFPVPMVLGIEEFLFGPLLNWIMEIGYPCMAYEAGAHHDLSSIENAEAFVWLSLVHGGLLSADQLPEYDHWNGILAKTNLEHRKVFEVRYKKSVKASDNFKMKPGYVNFQKIDEEEVLAVDKTGDLKARESGRIFMPLYQDQGSDGYFEIRRIAPFWLNLSARLRKMRFERVLTLLPGVNTDPKEKYTLVVNRKTARFLAVELFHLLGFRSKTRSETEIRFSKREYDVRGVAEHH